MNKFNEEVKVKLYEVLTSENISESIDKNMGYLLYSIPEIESMIGFEHKHPHHHLDVWRHTIEVINNLDSKEIDLKLAALFHDIGKPFSYQDDEVRHFHGHPEVSSKMTEKILIRLGYDKEFIDNVVYLVETHDTIINPNKLDNTKEMIQKRLKLQYADAKAHHPDKVEKRIKFLDNISKQLNELEIEER